METLLPTRDLALLYNVAEGSIRRWASEDRIKPAKTCGRRNLFRHDDFQQAYDRRHPEQP